ncbi:MAG: Uma2 family endonuclease [Acidobacteria bacterium]|nr:Uma2 family endonuclease [Acidobacteriota bacterium]
MTPVQAAQRKVTYTDLESWPDDGRRYELYDGGVYVCPAPMPRHQIATQELFSHLRKYALLTRGLVLVSPIDIVFDEFNVLQPDIAFFQASRRHHVSLDKVTRVPPDVVVEVISPGTVKNDLGRKKATFARFGVPEYWLLDPHIERMERHSLVNGAYESTLSVAPGEDFRSDVLDGFACAVSSLFPW